MKNLVISSKRAYKLSGKSERKLSKDEIEKSKVMRRSITLKNDLKKNQMISLDDIDLQRPGTGISPNYFNKIINKKIKKNLNSGEVLKWNLIK